MKINFFKKNSFLNTDIPIIFFLLILVFGSVLFYFRSVYFGHLVFYHSDLFDSEFTLRAYFWKMIYNGLFTPLYPYDSLSHSLLMNPHHKILYPTNLIFLSNNDPYRMAHWDYLLHYGIAALGWYFYFKSLISSRATAFFSALILTFNGVVLSSHFRVEIASFAWVPWTVWCFLKTIQSWEYRNALLTGLFLSLVFLGGNPELCVITGLLALFSVFFRRGRAMDGPSHSGNSFARKDCVRRLWLFTLIPITMGLILLPLLLRAVQDVPLSARRYGFEKSVAMAWSTSPYAIFELAGNWVSRFLSSSDMAQTPISTLVRENWYANYSIGLIGAVFLLFGFAKLIRDLKGRLLFLTCILLWCLSMGEHHIIALWSWLHIGTLQKFRFPGKFFRYFLIVAAIPLSLGIFTFHQWLYSRLSRRLALVIFILITMINLFQILWEQPEPLVSTLSEKVTPLIFKPFQGKESFAKTRIGYCRSFLGRTSNVYLDGRALGLAMASTGDAAELPAILGLECRPLFAPTYYDWLGITHLITPHIPIFDTLKAQVPTLATYYDRIQSQIAVPVQIDGKFYNTFYDVFQLKRALGPSEALFSEYWYFADLQKKREFALEEPRFLIGGIHFKRLLNGYFPVQESIYLNEDGVVTSLDVSHKEQLTSKYGVQLRCPGRDVSKPQFTRFPIQLAADLSMKIEGQTECPGILSIPWAAISGWRAIVNGEHRPIVRVGDTTLGILVPKGKWQIALSYDPKYLGLTLFISVMTFVMIIVLIGINLAKTYLKGNFIPLQLGSTQ